MMIGTAVATTLVSLYALASPTTSPLVVSVLIALLAFAIRLFLNVSSRRDLPLSCLSLALGLSIGTLLSFVVYTASPPSLLSVFAAADVTLGLVLYVVTATVFPLSAILVAETLAFRFAATVVVASDRRGPKTTHSRIVFPALLFSLTGIAQERFVGVGRSIWWVQNENDSDGTTAATWSLLAKLTRGPVLVDFVVAVVGYSIASVVAQALFGFDGSRQLGLWAIPRRREDEEEVEVVREERDLLHDDGNDEHERNDEEEVRPVESTPLLFSQAFTRPRPDASDVRTTARSRRLSRPVAILAFFLVFALVFPLFPSRPVVREHPSLQDPDYTYPPISVGCVGQPGDHVVEGETSESQVDRLLRETKTVASRGVKIMSWGETAISIVEEEHRGTGKNEGREGWEGLGTKEQALLERVGEIAATYKVYILATYSLEHRRHRSGRFNVATLIGPARRNFSSSSSASVPEVVFSTTKHHPVPFVESYSHSRRFDSVLGSRPGEVLPLATIAVPLAASERHPRDVKSQALTVSTAICQDISYPSLLNSYHHVKRPGSELDDEDDVDDETEVGRKLEIVRLGMNRPGLILNPAKVPVRSIALRQFHRQARSRAVEQSSWILTCDDGTARGREGGGGGGVSGLIAPDGTVRVVYPAGTRGASWSGFVDAEAAGAARDGAGSRPERGWGLGLGAIDSELATWVWIVIMAGVVEVAARFDRRKFVEMGTRIRETIRTRWSTSANRVGQLI